MSNDLVSGKRPALGRGLAALIPGAGAQTIANQPSAAAATVTPQADLSTTMGKGYREIPINDVVANRYQPRHFFDDPKIAELATSIAADGVIQPILVRRAGAKFEIIAGERRWRASRKAGLTQIPAIVKEASDLDSLILALEENLQRADLNPLEEALAYEQLIEEFSLTQEEVARRVGRERSTVANMLRLLRLPEAVKEDLVAGKLSMGHARALLSLEGNDLVLKVRKEILAKDLSVRATEALINQIKQGADETPNTSKGIVAMDPQVRHVLDDLRRRFGTRVSLKGSPRRGRLELEYYSPADLNRIIGLLKGS